MVLRSNGLEADMTEIRRVSGNVFDVFYDNGWNAWTRVRKGRSFCHVIGGRRLPHREMKHLNDILHPTMPIVYGQPQETTLNNCRSI